MKQTRYIHKFEAVNARPVMLKFSILRQSLGTMPNLRKNEARTMKNILVLIAMQKSPDAILA
jgi:hypothetical protein